jgi:CheY-like chemotaxis protein
MSASESDKVSILLVDDQEARLLSYEAILEDLHQNLVRANSGTEALKRLMKEDFAVVLLDVNMPVMDGFETARMIRQHPRYEATPIVFVTAIHDTDFDRRKGYELGRSTTSTSPSFRRSSAARCPSSSSCIRSGAS